MPLTDPDLKAWEHALLHRAWSHCTVAFISAFAATLYHQGESLLNAVVRLIVGLVAFTAGFFVVAVLPLHVIQRRRAELRRAKASREALRANQESEP